MSLPPHHDGPELSEEKREERRRIVTVGIRLAVTAALWLIIQWLRL